MTNADPDRQELIRLRKLLIDSFDLEELRVLCFDMGLDYEDLAGKTKTTKMQDLITYLQRRGDLQQLLDEVKSQRPNVDWPEFEPSKPTTEDSVVDNYSDTYTDAKTGLEMIRIPAGEFIYGEDVLERLIGKPTPPEYFARLEYLPEFWISKTPVTNAQYLRFVKAKYEVFPPEHWKGESPKAEIANHPVVQVSWDDAKAYANWAGMDLPREKEWEKAARGTDGQIYPWGNEWRDGHCNTEETGIGTTTPVGQYSPQGDSPYGCVDMAGNVWEWTASWYDKKKARRAVRGGSWPSIQYNARAAARLDLHPASHYYDRGFRLVVRRPPSQ